MKFEIRELGRTVELIDEIVKELSKYEELDETLFVIPICSKYGESYSKSDVSDEELSLLCNRVMLEELKSWNTLPKAIAYIEANYEKWTNSIMQEAKYK